MDIDDIFFDDDNGVSEVFKELFKIADKECKHNNIKSCLDGRGYCIDCGVIFSDSEDVKSDCKHKNVAKDDNTGVNICKTCGKEFECLDFSQEWRYFGASDNRSTQDPSRCRKPKSSKKSIETFFQGRSETFHNALIQRVEYRYEKVIAASCNNLLRGKGRKAIIAICTFYSLQDDQQFRTLDHVKNIFDVEQKDMSEAETKYYIAFPEDRTRHLTPQKLMKWIMEITKTDMKHYRRIMLISEYFMQTSKLIERSTPQSVAASTIYFYLHYFRENEKISKPSFNKLKSQFANDAGLSDITVSKICKEMQEIANQAAKEYLESK